MNRTWLAVASALALTVAVGCGKDEGDSSSTTTTGGGGGSGTTGGGGGDATAGADVYATSCAGCHGANGEGGTGPAMETAVAGLSESDVANVALNGEGGMPAILSDAGDAADVGAYSIATWGG